ncbi:MAG: class I SAM-dependent methyltransferase, partial [Ginsengibacter sp.]
NRWEYDLTINEFFKEIPVLKILDIGTGAGFFLDKVNCPLKYAMEGSETNRTLLKQKGYHVLTGDNEFIEKNRESFNYITMFQVLEHISDFENIFIRANRISILQGTLIISVPDCDAMILQEKLTGYPDIFPNHINKWTPQSLELVLNKFGFKKEEVIYEAASFRKFLDSVHLKISHRATMNGTLAANIYKIKNKKIRILLLLFYSMFVLPSLLPYYKKLSGRGSFLLRAVKVNAL